MTSHRKPNKLVASTSPYLQQHAFNPVSWYPWGAEALLKARTENKPMIVSVGYSACHWCHVMERECFENDEIAAIMNEHFVCIKVDREERPDVDQVYMEAVHAMGLNGGWPLNVFTLPDQKPFYGGTYFPPKQWVHILKSISEAYKNNHSELLQSAEGFQEALSRTDTEKYGLTLEAFGADKHGLQSIVSALSVHFDSKHGGLQRAPKFPSPAIWQFLLQANSILANQQLEDQINSTLLQMASGGIYDHIGGGFARYSVDDRWFAPHFEKMLYDNGQLISLYARAWQSTSKDRYKEVVFESIDFIERELTSPQGGFYSALDADSDGEEGNYYIWSEKELEEMLGADAMVVKKYFQTQPTGNWERGMNILHTRETIEEFAAKNKIDAEVLSDLIKRSKKVLLEKRELRNRPGLDNKIITSWNALMLRGLVDSYRAFGKKSILDLALKNASFIHDNLMKNGALIRCHTEDDNKIPAFLDDYAFLIDAWVALYQVTFDERWLQLAGDLMTYTIAHFYDPEEGLFFYTDDSSEKLIARKKEVFDNVIPASNSAMAINLFTLGKLMDDASYLQMAENMLGKFSALLHSDPQYLCHWAMLYAMMASPLAEIAIIGKDCLDMMLQLEQRYIPNKIVSGHATTSTLPLLQGKVAIKGSTTIYVCYNKSCKLPIDTVDEAFRQII